MEASAHAGNRSAVVIHHCKTKADRQKQAFEIVEMKHVLAASGGEGRFHPVPNHQDRCKGPEQVLAHGVEEAKILREQVGGGLKDELQVVPRSGSFDASGLSNSFYGIRKFCRELVSVPL